MSPIVPFASACAALLAVMILRRRVRPVPVRVRRER
jgi:hypothetical protein